MIYPTLKTFLGAPAGGTEHKISALINSACYFISDVYIVDRGDRQHYRLCAAHKGKILIEKNFDTLRGAKIAFSRLFKHRCGTRDIKAHWSHFYSPDLKWLKNRGGNSAAH